MAEDRKLERPKVAPIIAFRFEGGIADNGELNFYEAGRYRYAAARLLYTLEAFRQSGQAPRRLTQRVEVDFRVRAAEHGSFVDPVFMLLAPIVAETFIKVPVDVLLTWAIHKIFPKAAPKERLQELTDPTSASNKAFCDVMVAQANALGEQAKAIRASHEAVIHSLKSATNSQIQLVDTGTIGPEILRSLAHEIEKRQASLEGYRDQAGNISDFSEELRSEAERLELLEDHSNELSKISDEQEERLTAQIRKTLPDLAKPLERSATRLSLRCANDNKKIAHITLTRAKQISSLTAGDEMTAYANIIRFDKQGYFGRAKITNYPRELSFSLAGEFPKSNVERVIEGMKLEKVSGVWKPIIDGSGEWVSLLLLEIELGSD